jgi:hypothetical protein
MRFNISVNVTNGVELFRLKISFNLLSGAVYLLHVFVN